MGYVYACMHAQMPLVKYTPNHKGQVQMQIYVEKKYMQLIYSCKYSKKVEWRVNFKLI